MGISFDGNKIAAERGAATGFTTATGDSANLTFEKLMAAMEKLRKLKLYYAVSEFIPQGDILWVSSGDFHPAYVVVHPSDFGIIKDYLGLYHPLIPLADYRPVETMLQPIRYRSRWCLR